MLPRFLRYLNQSWSSSKFWGPWIRIVGSGLGLMWLSYKLNWHDLSLVLARMHWGWGAGALGCLVLSRLVAFVRVDALQRHIGIELAFRPHLRFYWVGTWYNLVLPGAVGGDAYKLLKLKNLGHASGGAVFKALIIDRINGLLAIAWILLVLNIIVALPKALSLMLWTGAAIGTMSVGVMLEYYFKHFRLVFWRVLPLSLLVQLLQGATCLLLHMSVAGGSSWPHISLIFYASSLMATVPVSVGGLGLREWVFLVGARQLGVDASEAVAVSLMFYMVSLVAALPALFMWRDEGLNLATGRPSVP